METKNLVFEEIKPGTRKEKVNTVRLWKNRLQLGALAYEELGQPSSLKVEVDVSKHVLRLTAQGPFSVSKTRTVSATALAHMEEGLYTPLGGGLYQWAVTEA
jgi:hypothetical protein